MWTAFPKTSKLSAATFTALRATTPWNHNDPRGSIAICSPLPLGWHHARKERGRQLRRPLLFLFVINLGRADDVFSGQFAQFYLHSNVAQHVGMLAAFGGLISQIDGAFGHTPVWHF